MKACESFFFVYSETAAWLHAVIALLNSGMGLVLIAPEQSARDLLAVVNTTLLQRVLPSPARFVSAAIARWDGREHVAVIARAGARKPYFDAAEGLTPQGVWLCAGETLSGATVEVIDAMIAQTDGEAFAARRCLWQNLSFSYAEAVFRARGETFGRPQQILLGLIGEQGLYTNLAWLLSDQCEYRLTLLCIAGTARCGLVTYRAEMGCSCFELRDLACEVLEESGKRRARDGFAPLHTDFPPKAFREVLLLILRCMHHEEERSILVRVYDDRMEICARIGGTDALSYAELAKGEQSPFSARLNRVLTRLDEAECPGFQLHICKELFKGCEDRFAIELAQNWLRITLPALSLHGGARKDGVYGRRRESAIACMRTRSAWRGAELQQALSLELRCLTRLMAQMTKEGYVTSEPVDGDRVYRLSDQLYLPAFEPPLVRVGRACEPYCGKAR
ncbi:MAG: hypothetical protein RSB91_09195 [Clostridia bacterium]